MELIRCKNGHMYDPSITPECPECARLGKTVPMTQREPQDGIEPTRETVPAYHDTVPMEPQGRWNDAQDYRAAGRASDAYNGGAEEYGTTVPLDYEETMEKGFRPITGWLVCVEGPEKGRDYRLHEDYNYIGRSPRMDVSIPGDPTVSRENHAIVAYDSQERLFFFAPFSGASIVRQNGKAVLSNVELKAGDRLQIGKSTFLFIPLCGEDFQW